MARRIALALVLAPLLVACAVTGESVNPTAPTETPSETATPEPTPPLATPRAPGEIRHDPAALLPKPAELPSAFLPLRRSPSKRANPYPMQSLDLGLLREDPLASVDLGMLVADSVATAQEYWATQQEQLARRYTITVYEQLDPLSESGPHIESPTPAPSPAPLPTTTLDVTVVVPPSGTPFLASPSAAASPTPTKRASSRPAPSAAPFIALGDDHMTYAVRLRNDARGYLVIWRRGVAVATVLVVADQSKRIPDADALALVLRLGKLVDSSMRAGLAAKAPPSTSGEPRPSAEPSSGPSAAPATPTASATTAP